MSDRLIRVVRPRRRVLVVGGIALALAATTPAAAQLRTDIGPRTFNVAPRVMSPGSFGTRLDPTFRTAPGGGGPTVGDSSTSSGTSSKSLKVQKSGSKADGNSGPPQGSRRARFNVPSANERRFVPDEVVIEAGGTFTEQRIQALAARFRLTRVESLRVGLTNTTFFRWRIPDGRSVPAVIRSLAADAVVRSAQPNYLYALAQEPARDPANELPQPASAPPGAAATAGDPAQYALAKLRLSEAHGLATGDQVVVAVIDSGIDVDHPELAGVIAGTYDALDSKEGPHAHGTGVAGIIAAHGRLMGAAPKVRILAVRAFGTTQGSTFSILKSLDWAAARRARIINMSFAGPPDPALQRAFGVLRQKGTVLVAAAGNAGPKSTPLYPAADPGVIAVTATDADDRLFAMANRGAHVSVAAPGVDILMPSPGGSYWVSSGTSMAAGYVSGVLALVLERRPQLTPDAARKVLLATARDLGPKGRDDQFGAGLTDAYRAVMSLETQAADGGEKAGGRR